MKGLPEGYTARPMTLEDAEIAAALANEYACAITGEAVTSAQHFQRFMGFPGMDLESSSRMCESQAGFQYLSVPRDSGSARCCTIGLLRKRVGRSRELPQMPSLCSPRMRMMRIPQHVHS